MAIFKVLDNGAYSIKIMALKLVDAANLKWLNAVVFMDQTMISDFNIVPFLGKDTINVD
jgi:hypothetical protein